MISMEIENKFIKHETQKIVYLAGASTVERHTHDKKENFFPKVETYLYLRVFAFIGFPQ